MLSTLLEGQLSRCLGCASLPHSQVLTVPNLICCVKYQTFESASIQFTKCKEGPERMVLAGHSMRYWLFSVMKGLRWQYHELKAFEEKKTSGIVINLPPFQLGLTAVTIAAWTMHENEIYRWMFLSPWWICQTLLGRENWDLLNGMGQSCCRPEGDQKRSVRRKILGIFFAPHFGCSTTGNFRAKLQF